MGREWTEKQRAAYELRLQRKREAYAALPEEQRKLRHVRSYTKLTEEQRKERHRNAYQKRLTRVERSELNRKTRATNRKRRYGISEADVQDMLERQKHLCPICGKPVTAADAVDHCHKTKKFRGVLHMPCNTALGMLRERPDIFRACIRYLERAKDAPCATGPLL